MSGYAHIHRSLVGHPAFRNDAEAMAFAYLVLRAAWQDTRVRYKGKALTLVRGQLAMSVRDLAEAMDRDKGWIERLLKRLRSETMVETHSETGVLVITICNYDEYQSDGVKRKTPRKTEGETRARQAQDTEQEREEGKKEENPLTPLAGGDCGFVIDRWNAMAGRTSLPQVETFAHDRERKLKARLAEHGRERVFAAIDAVERSPLCLGQNDRGWRANFDFILQPKSFAKLLEGAYGGAPSAANDPHAKPASPEAYAAFCLQSADRCRQMGREREAIDWEAKARGEEPRRNGTGPPRPIGALIAQATEQIGMH